MSHEKAHPLFVCALALLISGCKEQAVRYPVAGKVVIDGEPVTMGSIQFVPEQGRPVAGKIGKDGSFRLAELSVDSDSNKSGVVAGKYRIGISSAEVVNEDADEMLNHIPEKYADYRTSELEVEIDSAQEDMLIELTWEGAKEIEEKDTSEENTEAETASETENAEAESESNTEEVERIDQEASNEE